MFHKLSIEFSAKVEPFLSCFSVVDVFFGVKNVNHITLLNIFPTFVSTKLSNSIDEQKRQ